MDNYSLSDIRAATEHEGYSDGWGGGGAWWIIILFLFVFMGGRGGWGGTDGALTRTDMQQGFDTAEITRKLDGITNGLSDGFYAQNTTMLNGFSSVTAAVNDARFASQQCCCETNRNIDSVRYDAQKNTCDIISAIHADGEATRNLIYQNKMEALQAQVNDLTLKQALCGVVRYPTGFTYSAGNSPFCGCGCNNI